MITFHKLRWKNLLSTGNTFTEIQLDRARTTLLMGESGSGKSTLLDALAFALFNRPFRNINRPQILNSINEKDGLVEIEFSANKRKYLVRRGMKPNIFEIFCDGKLLNQDASARGYQEYLEKQILKFNFKSFSQIVVLGASNFVPFMQLKPADRRLIIEELLDIQVFSSMNTLLKDKISKNAESLRINSIDTQLVVERIDLHKKYIENLSKDIDARKAEIEKEIAKSKKSIEYYESEKLRLSEKIGSLQTSITDAASLKAEIQKLTSLKERIVRNSQEFQREKEFYSHNEQCPTCKQKISPEFKQEKIDEADEKLAKNEQGVAVIQSRETQHAARVQEIKSVSKDINALQIAVHQCESSIHGLQVYLNKLNKELNGLESPKPGLVDDGELSKLQEELKAKEAQKEELILDRDTLESAKLILKDTGIKARIVKQYLPVINKQTNKYLNSMNFFVAFTMNENFEEKVKSRGRDDFSYANFSEGEKQRIDLALLFTWRTVAKLKNSVNVNLLVMDEILDSYLDNAATENVLALLKTEAFKDTSIFVISHKETIGDKFDRTIRFSKEKNFSRIVMCESDKVDDYEEEKQNA